MKNRSIKEEILRILKTPISVSQLKKQLPHVSSFGTIAYHLKNLEEKGLIKKRKMDHLRGKPTYYYLKEIKLLPMGEEELEKKWEETQKNLKLKVLQLLKEKPRIDDFFSKYEELFFTPKMQLGMKKK